jgi:hypothetical protein
MATTGTATLDFGTAAQRKTDVSIAVTGQAGIGTSSHVEAFLQGDTTADHSPDEHVMLGDMLGLVCSDIVAGTGFTIYGLFDHQSGLSGQVSVHWVWA